MSTRNKNKTKVKLDRRLSFSKHDFVIFVRDIDLERQAEIERDAVAEGEQINERK